MLQRRSPWLVAIVLAFVTAPALAAPPDEPRVITGIEIGKPGGELRMLIGRERDTRYFNTYGYAHLIGFTPELELVPDILASYEVEEDRIFTLRLRKGHKWSDGQPFTAEDIRFYWDDVENNEDLTFSGPDIRLLVEGEKPKVELVDELTVRWSWSKPNRFFIPALAAANQLFIYRPAHYLKQFHQKYADPEKLEAAKAENGARDWIQLFLRKDRLNDFDDPDMPTLMPWRLVTRPPAQRFVAERNPNFHRVDETGQQLPYIDRFVLDIVDSKLVPIKTGAGEVDLQSRYLVFKDYTFLRESEARNGLTTLLWPGARSSHLALFPNLNATDEVWRGLFRQLEFRKALAMGIDRDAISQFMYAGIAMPANNTILPASPLWRDELANECQTYDPERANEILDGLGLDQRNPAGIRLLPDGRPMELVVESSGEDNEQSDVLELVADQWSQIGFKIASKPSDRQIMRQPRLCRQRPDGDVLRHRQRRADFGHAAARLRAHQPGRPAAMAAMGPTLRDQGRGRRRRPTCPRPSGCSSCTRSGSPPARSARPRSGTRCWGSSPASATRSASSPTSRNRSPPAPRSGTCPRKRSTISSRTARSASIFPTRSGTRVDAGAGRP